MTLIRIMNDANIRRSMSRRSNCWDNAPQESFFGHMKDHLMERISKVSKYYEVKFAVDDYMDYYNNERYVWDLAYLSPNEFYDYVMTGKYPLNIPNPPMPVSYDKKPENLGKKKNRQLKYPLKIYVVKKTEKGYHMPGGRDTGSTYYCS